MTKFTYLFLSYTRDSFRRSIKAYAYLKHIYVYVYMYIYIYLCTHIQVQKIPIFKEKL